MLIAEIEFRGIQKFIFSSPRLRDMVGANVLLGETIRRRLVSLAAQHQAVSLEVPDELKGGAIVDDPLMPLEDIDRDDPAALYAMGILSRDGGHLRVCMADGEPGEAELSHARAFLSDAGDLLEAEVPGLRYDLRLITIDGKGQRTVLEEGDARTDLREVMLLASPYFALCNATGTERATEEWTTRDRVREPVAASVYARRQAYDRWKEGKAGDIISLIDRWMRAEGSADQRETPPDISKMCGKDYFAVIHADGNNVGNRAIKAAERIKVTDRASFLRQEAAFERFHHRNRVGLRKAMTKALDANFGATADPGFRPFQLLMLGGDDLLLICQAKKAMPFVQSLCANLADSSEAEPLTLGIGVAIAAPNLPIHRLVDLAEDLATSAKRLFRRLDRDGLPASVVDWHIETGSWTPEIGSHRRKNELVRYGSETCALIQRPLRVIEDKRDTADGAAPPQLDRLAGLLRAEKATTGAARNKLRKMSASLSQGRRAAEAAFEDLPQETRDILRDPARVGLTDLWRSPSEGFWVTPMRDLVELYEIANLATNRATATGEP